MTATATPTTPGGRFVDALKRRPVLDGLTKPCTCGGVMEYGPATSDDSGPGGREVPIKAGWACADCWRVEPETHAPEAADRVEGVDP